MATLRTSKPINAGQLSVELGRVAVRVTHGDEASIEAPDVGESALRAAVEAHVANPDWVDPNYTPPPPDPSIAKADEAEARLAALADKGWANLSATEKTEVAQRAMEAIGFRRKARG